VRGAGRGGRGSAGPPAKLGGSAGTGPGVLRAIDRSGGEGAGVEWGRGRGGGGSGRPTVTDAVNRRSGGGAGSRQRPAAECASQPADTVVQPPRKRSDIAGGLYVRWTGRRLGCSWVGRRRRRRVQPSLMRPDAGGGGGGPGPAGAARGSAPGAAAPPPPRRPPGTRRTCRRRPCVQARQALQRRRPPAMYPAGNSPHLPPMSAKTIRGKRRLPSMCPAVVGEHAAPAADVSDDDTRQAAAAFNVSCRRRGTRRACRRCPCGQGRYVCAATTACNVSCGDSPRLPPVRAE
jgi:hypothetical protein